MVIRLDFPFVKHNLEGLDEEKRPHRVQSKQSIESFEAKMKSFLRDSNERLHDLKRNTEGKRGGRGGRRD